jgi:hypothetical protein
MENFELNRITLELTRIKESKDFDCNRGCGEGNPIADQNRVRVWLIYEDRRGAGVGLNSAFIYVLQAEVCTCEPAMSQTRRDSDIVKFSINHLPFVRSFPSLSPLSSTPALLRHELNTFGIVPGRAAAKTMPCKTRGSLVPLFVWQCQGEGNVAYESPINHLSTTL